MSTPRSGGWLIAAAAALACAGTFLLYGGTQPQTGAPTPRPTAAAIRTTSAPVMAAAEAGPAATGTPTLVSPPSQARSPIAAAPSLTSLPAEVAAAGPSELPHPESGEAADPLIQEAMDKASPRDLPPADEALLLRQGRAAWLAETARYARMRIQAVTARRDTTADSGGPGRAVVRLVWAGADPAGTFLDGRPGTVHFTQNGDGSWKQTL
ncbi:MULTISPECIES: hypothetical protein [Streptomyces]|uniref:hypothetical protein n=2 Tax=Streptomyces TaxID=1883 RepID=UPI0009624B09|nr:hypothetical protein [Streptomyces sp. CB03578]OKI26620.1 hypothetical protein A6A28_16740 [Streptomyces sp. CB03578]